MRVRHTTCHAHANFLPGPTCPPGARRRYNQYNLSFDEFLENADRIVALVIGQKALALGVGALAGLLVGLNRADRRAVTMEVGIQNSGLGLVIAFTFFPELGGVLLVAAFWGVWHLVSGLTLAQVWSRRPLPADDPVHRDPVGAR